MSRLINADKLKKDILDLPDCYNGFSDTYDKACIIGVIEGQPIIERKKGKWIDMGDFEQCSVCLGTRLKEFQTFYGKVIWIKTDFCPNCGADMRGETWEHS